MAQPTTHPSPATTTSPSQGPYTPTLIIHGGAGGISRESLPPELYAKYHASLLAYLQSTQALLLSGSSAIEAACHAVSQFEDDPLFNCGRGSVFTSRGEIEMEASLAVTSIEDRARPYEGQLKRSAAVSMVTRTRHPILLAREVLGMADESAGLGGAGTMHGHLSGMEVEEWGFARGLERKPRKWFWTRRRWEEHRRGLGRGVLDEEVDFGDEKDDEAVLELPSQGTVGAVCMDSWGIIAVATSTGGLTNKKPGRIGDTPTVGAGFWAESWDKIQPARTESVMTVPKVTFSEQLAATAKAELNFWLGGCLGMTPALHGTAGSESNAAASLASDSADTLVEKQPPESTTFIEPMTYSKGAPTHRIAIAMSGTGNGDSFLRTNACRTVAAISRFTSTRLQEALNTVTGPGGELQRSAGDRWGSTGEGQAGIIGIELDTSGSGKVEGRAVFDFNCGGLWRAYFEKDQDGKDRPRVMVFREEY